MGLGQAVRCSTLADADERARLKEIEVHAGSLGDGFVLSGLMRLQRFRTAQEWRIYQGRLGVFAPDPEGIRIEATPLLNIDRDDSDFIFI